MEALKHINRLQIALIEKFGWGFKKAEEELRKIDMILIAPNIEESPALQAAFLTVLHCASKAFGNTIKCKIPKNIELRINWSEHITFNQVVKELKGDILPPETRIDSHYLKVLFGSAPQDENSIEVIANGWQAGLNTFYSDRVKLNGEQSHPMGGVAAGSLAVLEVFNKVFEFDKFAFIRSKGISLWEPNEITNWADSNKNGPELKYFPRDVWFSGLGHLGQASLWLLGLFKELAHNGVCCVLQDDDFVDKANIYTQLLSRDDDIGKPKARVCAVFLEDRGFKTRVLEKRMTTNEYEDCQKLDLPVLINGYDNVNARRIIQPNSFDLVVDSGVGSSVDLFDSITQYGFPQINRLPSEIWAYDETPSILNPNYTRLIEKITQCGMMYSSAIATPFVGCFSAALAFSEILRAYHKGKRLSMSSLQMRSLEDREFVLEQSETTPDLFKKRYIKV